METSTLKPGDPHYRAFVGPPAQYDFMGATQFRLLTTLGLRAGHSLLDVGCGSLRAGRLFLPYLEAGNYCGIEPNRWLIDEAVRREIGQDLIALKQPRWDYNADFRTDVFGQQFDFIVAQSIFSHTGPALIATALVNFAATIKSAGLILVTFDEAPRDNVKEGWIYPHCVGYRTSSIVAMARRVGLHAKRIPWFHPRQTWFVLTLDPTRLPTAKMMPHLSGAVLFAPEFPIPRQGIRQLCGRIKASIVRRIRRRRATQKS